MDLGAVISFFIDKAARLACEQDHAGLKGDLGEISRRTGSIVVDKRLEGRFRQWPIPVKTRDRSPDCANTKKAGPGCRSPTEVKASLDLSYPRLSIKLETQKQGASMEEGEREASRSEASYRRHL